MRAGKLRHRGDLYDGNRTQDKSGQLVDDPQLVAKCVPIEVQEVSGGETLRGKQVQATATHVVSLRYREGITTRHHWNWNGRRLGIMSARDPDGRKRELLCECGEYR